MCVDVADNMLKLFYIVLHVLGGRIGVCMFRQKMFNIVFIMPIIASPVFLCSAFPEPSVPFVLRSTAALSSGHLRHAYIICLFARVWAQMPPHRPPFPHHHSRAICRLSRVFVADLYDVSPIHNIYLLKGICEEFPWCARSACHGLGYRSFVVCSSRFLFIAMYIYLCFIPHVWAPIKWCTRCSGVCCVCAQHNAK